MNTKVSVIIPNYNHAVYLRQRIKSVLDQTYENMEIIILDDHSTDNSRQIIEEYSKEASIDSIVINDKNSGSPFKQWAKGVSIARGEIIWIAESDDYAHPELVEDLVKDFHNDIVVLSYCDSHIVDEKGHIINNSDFWKKRHFGTRWERNYCNNGYSELMDVLRFKNTIPNASAVLFRKSAVDISLLEKVNMKYAGDWYIWQHLLAKGDISYHSRKLNFFRQHDQSTRNNGSFEKQLQLCKERLTNIKLASTTFQRIAQIKKYDWFIFEWISSTEIFNSRKIIFPPFPLEFLIRLWWKLILIRFSNYWK